MPVLLILALVFFCLAVGSTLTGKTPSRSWRMIRREEEPATFWTMVITEYFAALASFVYFLVLSLR
jgi:hypothetical protein